MKKIMPLSALLIYLFGCSLVSAASEIKIGVQSPRSAMKAYKRWVHLGRYLQQSLNIPVKIIPLRPDNTIESIKSGKVDYVLTNPVLTLVLKEKLHTIPLVTMVTPSGKYFAGVIIAGKGSGITQPIDLKGKKVMGYKFKRSAGAYVFQVKYLLSQGVVPEKDFALFYEAKNQDSIVLAVRAGVFDAGFIKSGLLESMLKDGIHLDDFIIINQQNDSLKNVHSTKLYPEWYITASKNTNTVERAKVKSALLKLKRTSPASQAANIVGFTEPLPMLDLSNTLKFLKLAPFN